MAKKGPNFTLITDKSSQDTLGRYFFQWHPEKVANRVIICSDFGSNANFELNSKKLQIGFFQNELAKKVLNLGFELLFWNL